jgi:hypothetical protein
MKGADIARFFVSRTDLTGKMPLVAEKALRKQESGTSGP